MANADTPFGLRPLRYLSGAPYNGAANKYYVPSTDSTAIYIGGLVKPAGSSDADGIMTVTGNVSTGNAVVGVMVGVVPTQATDTIYRQASVGTYILVADDPNLVFAIQEDSVGGALAATNLANAADIITFTGGSTVTGRSALLLDSSTATASGDGTEDVLIVRLLQAPDNAIGSLAKWEVRLNNHFYIDGQAGA